MQAEHAAALAAITTKAKDEVGPCMMLVIIVTMLVIAVMVMAVLP